MAAIVRDYQREFDALRVSIRRRFYLLALLQIVSSIAMVWAMKAL